jgi:predicted transcriptional regulator
MTLASDRRILELEIIDAARVIAARNDADPGIKLLQSLIGRLDHLELEAASKAAHPSAGPITSIEAAESLTNVGQLAHEVLKTLAAHRGGLTCDEIEQLMNGRHQTISARVNELRDKGWIKDSGVKRRTRSGRRAIVWVPTWRAAQQLHKSLEW